LFNFRRAKQSLELTTTLHIPFVLFFGSISRILSNTCPPVILQALAGAGTLPFLVLSRYS
jgi:hypothetical protein